MAEADAEDDDAVAAFDELTTAPEAVFVPEPDVVVASVEPEVIVDAAPAALLAALEAVELAVETHETTDGRLVTPEVLHRF